MKEFAIFYSMILGIIQFSQAQTQPLGNPNFPTVPTLSSELQLNMTSPAAPYRAASINSLQSGLWNAPGTWDCGCIPGQLDDVNILGGHSIVLNLDVAINSLYINTGGELAIDSLISRDLTVYNDWSNNGNFIPESGTVIMGGSADQNLFGSTVFHNLTLSGTQNVTNMGNVAVSHLLKIDGTNFFTNNLVTLLVVDGKSASLDQVLSGNIVGDLIVQKNVTPGKNGWITVSAPSNSSTIEDWNDNFVTTGFFGSDYPGYSFKSIQYYDEAINGFSFVGIDSSTQAIIPGLGYYIYVNAGNYNFETVGSPVIGNMNLPVSYTPQGILEEDGINVLGNPYACDINWDSPDGWNKFNINGAIYIWDVSQNQFKVYINGYGINGGSPKIKSCEAFWVQTNAANPQLTINEQAKVVNWIPVVNTSNDFLKMSLSNGSDVDEFVIAFNETAAPEYESAHDAFKFYSDGNVPNISTHSEDGVKLSVNSRPLANGNFDIPVVIHAPQGGDMTLNVLNFPTMETMACIALEDLQTGQFYDLATTDSINFNTADVQEEVRFMIHVGGKINIQGSDVLCYGESNGGLVAVGTGSGPWDYIWTDETGNVIDTQSSIPGPSMLGNIAAGTYTVEILNNDFCASLSKTITINEPDSIYIVSENITNIACNEVATGQIDLVASGGTGVLSYLWSNGSLESTTSNLSPGVYDVKITDENGCTLLKEYTVDPAPTVLAFFEADNQVIDLVDGSATISFSNSSENATDYLWTFGDGGLESTAENTNYTYTQAGNYIVMLTASNSVCDAVYQIVVQVQEIVTSIEETPFTNGISLNYIDDQLTLSFSLSQPQYIEINGYNLLGQQLIEPIQGRFANEQITLQMNHRSPVAIITIVNKDNGESQAFKIIH